MCHSIFRPLMETLLRLATALLLALLPWAARAATGPWVSETNVRARLLAATDGAGQGGDIHAELEISLNDGWDTYWRSPGDAGAAPTIDWSGSTNVASVGWRWPAPTRFVLLGLETFGYLHEVLFPLTVHPERPGESVALRGALDILVCSNVCIPKHLELSLALPASAAAPDADAANLIARFEARVPTDGSRSGLSMDGAQVEPGNPAFLNVRIASRQPLSPQADLIVESPKWSFGRPAFSFDTDGRTATATLPVTSGPEAVTMPGANVTVTLEDGPRASET